MFDDFIGKELSGSDFNRIYKNYKFVKLTNKEENHNNFQFQDGLNIDNIPFNPNGSCSKGGIYFIEEQNIGKWTQYGTYIMYYVRDVIIPNDAKVYVEKDKFKADKLILSVRMSLNKKYTLIRLKKNGYELARISNSIKDKDMCMIAICENNYAIMYVPKSILDKDIYLEATTCFSYDSSYNITMLAICINGLILEHVPEELKDRKICINALKENGNALQFVPEILKDREMCDEAITNNGNALQFVPEELKDRDMCTNAVKQTGNALRFVPEHMKNREICMKAMKVTDYSLEYVPEILRDDEMYLENLNGLN